MQSSKSSELRCSSARLPALYRGVEPGTAAGWVESWAGTHMYSWSRSLYCSVRHGRAVGCTGARAQAATSCEHFAFFSFFCPPGRATVCMPFVVPVRANLRCHNSFTRFDAGVAGGAESRYTPKSTRCRRRRVCGSHVATSGTKRTAASRTGTWRHHRQGLSEDNNGIRV